MSCFEKMYNNTRREPTAQISVYIKRLWNEDFLFIYHRRNGGGIEESLEREHNGWVHPNKRDVKAGAVAALISTGTFWCWCRPRESIISDYRTLVTIVIRYLSSKHRAVQSTTLCDSCKAYCSLESHKVTLVSIMTQSSSTEPVLSAPQ